MRRVQLVIALFGLVGVVAWVAAGRLKQRPTDPPSSRQESRTEPARTIVSAAGRIEAFSEEVAVGAEITGRVVEILVEEGERVVRGQRLARLDDGEYRARLDSALALRRQKESELLRLRNGSREQERREARLMIREAEATMENMRTERDRRMALFRTGDIAREEVERAERQFEVARARHEAAIERHSLIDAPARSEDIARAEAELALAEAGIDSARVMFDKTVVRAPLGGTVLRRHLRVGEIAASGVAGTPAPILTLADLSRLRVRAEIDELDVGRVRSGQPAWVTIDAYADRRFNGRVTRVGQILGRKTLRSDNPAEKLDTKILETLIDLDQMADPSVSPQIGLRVNVFVDTRQSPP